MLRRDGVLFGKDALIPLFSLLTQTPSLQIINNPQDVDHLLVLQAFVVRDLLEYLQLLRGVLQHLGIDLEDQKGVVYESVFA